MHNYVLEGVNIKAVLCFGNLHVKKKKLKKLREKMYSGSSLETDPYQY